MGLVFADIERSNAQQADLKPMLVNALVDSGTVHSCIPRHVALQLNLCVHDRRGLTLADGREEMVDHVGPMLVRFANRRCLVGALVLGDQPLLGAIPIEDMDLGISPSCHTRGVNPKNPNIAMSVAMGVGR